MTIWLGFIVISLTLAVVTILPGALLLSRSRLEPVAVLATAPAVSILMVSAACLVLAFADVPWNTPVQAVVLAAPCLLLIGRRPARSPESLPEGEDSLTQFTPGPGVLGTAGRAALAAVPATVLQLVLCLPIMGSPGAILQNHDAILHLNLIETIHRSGNASMLSAARSINGGFYPDAFHAVAVILRPFVSAPVILNAGVIAIGAMLTPFVLVLLARSVGLRWWACALAPLLGMSTMWMPGFMLFFNAQVPAGLAVAVMIGALASLTATIRAGRTSLPATAALSAVLIAGAGVAHPGGAQCLLVMVCLGGAMMVGGGMGPSGRPAPIAPLERALLAALCLLPVALMPLVPILRVMAGFPDETLSVPDTLAKAILLSPLSGYGGALDYLPVVLAAAVGALYLLVTRRWEPVAAWAAVALLVVSTASTDPGIGALTGGWWRDPLRLVGMLALLDGVLAAAACDALAGRIPQALRGGWAARARVIGAGALTLVLCASALGTTVKTRQWTVYSFQVFLHTEWISAEEMEQMVGEDATVFDGAVVFGVPDSGVSYVGVLTQGQSFYRQRSRPVGEYGIYLAHNFNEILTDPEVCVIINDQGGTPLYYVDESLPDSAYDDYPGFRDVDTSVGFVKVAELGPATVWRITACD